MPAAMSNFAEYTIGFLYMTLQLLGLQNCKVKVVFSQGIIDDPTHEIHRGRPAVDVIGIRAAHALEDLRKLGQGDTFAVPGDWVHP
jgi:hypothetical protein